MGQENREHAFSRTTLKDFQDDRSSTAATSKPNGELNAMPWSFLEPRVLNDGSSG